MIRRAVLKRRAGSGAEEWRAGPRRANALVRSDVEGALAQGALEALLQVVDRFCGGIPVRAVRHRLIESSPGMTESSLEEIRVFGQCGGL